MPGFRFGFGPRASRRSASPSQLPKAPPVAPSSEWTGAVGSGFTAALSDPVRLTAKPIVRLLDVPRQTVTDRLVVGVGAAANHDGFLLPTMGIARMVFHFEGGTTSVDAPSWRTLSRHDGSTYTALGWWAMLRRPAGMQGLAHLYVEAVPIDPAMQSRVIGPFVFLLYATPYDHDIVVRADGAGDFTSIGAALTQLAALGAQRPRIRIAQAGTYDLGGISANYEGGAGWCTIEASAQVTIAQAAPASEAAFPRFRPNYERLRFKGPGLTLDFVETLQFYNERPGGEPWFDRVSIVQSRGRSDLWRKVPRNIVPSLTRQGGYFTECFIRDVNDACDKAFLARGNLTDSTWGDLFQGAECVAHNRTTDHSSAFYYTNVDAMTVQYAGTATTATVSRTGGNFICREDGVDVLTFVLQNTPAAFTADTNYRVASLVDAINALPGWTATLLDDSRCVASISAPDTTNGANFTNLDVKTAKTLPTHFDIHSDWFQVPNSSFMQNVYLAFNEAVGIDAQNFLIATDVAENVRDFAIIGNAFYNNLGTPDEGLQTGLGTHSRHLIFAHNTFATQRISIPSQSGTADAYTLIANNTVLRMTVTNSEPLNPAVTVRNNHVQEANGLPLGTVGTIVGGNSLDLFVDARNGDFFPTGVLLGNPAQAAMGYAGNGQFFGSTEPVGSVALGTAEAPASRPPEPPVVPAVASLTTAAAISSGSNSVSLAAYGPAPGEDRRIIVIANVRGQGCSGISATLTGSAGTVALQPIVFQGSRFDDLHASALESVAALDIAEGQWPGEGPYTITATAAHATTAGGMAIQVFTIADARDGASVVAGNGSVSGGTTPLTETIALAAPASLVIGALATSTFSTAANWSQGLVQFGSRLDYGDLQMIGVAGNQPAGILTATVDRSLGREAIILFAYPGSD